MDTANSDPNANRPSPDDPRHRTPDSQNQELDDLWSKYKYAIIGAPIAIIVAVGVAMWMEVQKEETFREARQAINAAETAEELQAVAEEFQGTVMGGEALLLLAGKQQEQEDLPAARASLERFAENYPKHPFISGAWFALAGIGGQQDEMDRALDLYTRVFNDYPNSYAAKPAREAAARILAERGEVEQAMALMEPILQDQPSPELRMQVETRMGLLARVNEPLSEIPDPEPEPEAGPQFPTGGEDLFRGVLPGVEGAAMGDALGTGGRQVIDSTQILQGEGLSPEDLENMPKLGNPLFEVESVEEGTEGGIRLLPDDAPAEEARTPAAADAPAQGEGEAEPEPAAADAEPSDSAAAEEATPDQTEAPTEEEIQPAQNATEDPAGEQQADQAAGEAAN
jgi:predicted negative regulator of RcsB-dependent stress response